MAQHDYVIANGTGAAVRSDLNNGLAAIVSQNSGATEPATMYAYQWWADTTTGLLKIRNSANNAWVTVGTLASANLGLAALASPTFTGTVTAPTFTASTAVNIPLGSAGSPTLFFTGDSNTGLFSPGADAIALATAGTNRLHITSGGNVGIGTASPGSALDVAGEIRIYPTGGAANLRFGIAGVEKAKITVDSSSNCAIETAGSERCRVDASGRFLVGTSSTSAGSTAILQGWSGDSTGSGILRLCRGQATPGNNTELGYVIFGDSTHTDAATIVAWRDGGTWSGTSKPTRLTFSVTADGASSPTERMRITNDGYCKASNTGSYPSPLSNCHQLANSANSYAVDIYNTNASLTSTVLQVTADRNTSNSTYNLIRATRLNAVDCFFVKDSGNVQNANNSYTGTSDSKLKENIVSASSQWNDIKNLQVRKFNFKAETGNSTHSQIGLIAQEVEQVSPGLVADSIDRDAEGNDLGTVTKSVNYSVLYMKAVKALQEAMERIEVLEQRLTDAGIA